MAQLTPVVKCLLILNLGIYFADMFFFGWALRNEFAFTIQSAVFERRGWEFLTFQFIHGSIGHVFFNSMGLFFFGPLMERWWGSGRFLFFYLVCGAAGAVLYSSLVFAGALPGSGIHTGLVGASAGIYGILAGIAVIAPALRVALLFPPITLSMRQLALVLLAIAVGAIILRIGGNEGGEAGHLGGAIMGFFLVMANSWMGMGQAGQEKRKGWPETGYNAKIRPRTVIDLESETEVDRILDKISREGFQGLTDDERELLRKATEERQDL